MFATVVFVLPLVPILNIDEVFRCHFCTQEK
uniref:Uncharacterized protein n=1 Tax=Anguilla anguilla TaxID=7936 RepID=A0A0E9R668_ANGAN